MENNEIQDVSRGGAQKELANDVAMLFSWAKVQNAPYRDFSRTPKRLLTPSLHSGEDPAAHSGGAASDHDDSPASTADLDQGRPASRFGIAPAETVVGQQYKQSHDPGARRTSGQEAAAASRAAMRASFQPNSLGKLSSAIGIYSLAGGVGKTTVSANLGKALCSLGEQLLLADGSGRGLLPFYFGATELRWGSRKFAAPGVNAPSIQVVAAEEVTEAWLDGEVKPLLSSVQRTIFDLGPLSGGLLSTLFSMCAVVLIPLLPDLNSIVSVATIERVVRAHATDQKKPSVFYLFNRFDEQSMNDQQARDLVVSQCGDRVLPMTLRHDWKLTEALHHGIAASDHTPGCELSQDYLELALWVRRVAPLRSAVMLPGRWSEQ